MRALRWLLPVSHSSASIAEHSVIWYDMGYGISLWFVGVSCPSGIPSQLLVHSHPARGLCEEQKRRWCCASTVVQQ